MKQEYFICPFCHERAKVSRLSDNIARCLKCNKTGDKKDFSSMRDVFEAVQMNKQKTLFEEEMWNVE